MPAKKQTQASTMIPPKGPPPLPTGTTNLTLGATKATVTKGKATSLRLVRVIKAPAQRIYDCFLDADAMVKWLPPHGFTGHVDRSDPKVGGGYRMRFATINRAWGHSFTGTYQELVPGKRIRYATAFESDDPVMANAKMQVTIDFKPVKGGTELTILQEGIPAGPAADGAPYGWSQSLDNLANLCEAELPF
ncbi:MAG: SRPBCC domain-containing protein [bacterium]